MSAGRQDDSLNQPTEELPSLHEDGPEPAPSPESGSAAIAA